jgi:hypothetical protein
MGGHESLQLRGREHAKRGVQKGNIYKNNAGANMEMLKKARCSWRMNVEQIPALPSFHNLSVFTECTGHTSLRSNERAAHMMRAKPVPSTTSPMICADQPSNS